MPEATAAPAGEDAEPASDETRAWWIQLRQDSWYWPNVQF